MINNFDSIEKVFFLGAGFSKAINQNYPLMPELSKKIKTKIIKGALSEYYKVTLANVGENIEELLTYLSLDLPWKPEYIKALDKALYINITKNISTTFSSPNAIPDKCDQDQVVRLFTDFIIENQSLCLTLNYDTLLEKIIYSRLYEKHKILNGCEKFYGVPIQPVLNRFSAILKSDLQEEKIPTILKLHGSINWMWAGISPSDPIYCSDKDDNSKKLDFFHSTLDLQHFIVPPTLDKSSFYNNNILKSIWSLAYIYLGLMKVRKEIYIIGFSLPDSDISIKYFFKEVMSTNKHRSISSTIYVINTDISDELKKRYKNVFPEENLNFDFCCQYAFDRFVKEKLSVNYNQ